MQKFSRNSFTCPFTILGFLPRMKRSAIGLFGWVMNNNVELCSDWLFHSAAHFTNSQEGNTGKIYISILSHAVISLGNYTVYKMRASGAAINMLAIETAFKCTIAFYFHFRVRDSRSHELCLYYGVAVLNTHFTRSDACQWCSGSVNHSPSSSVISPYSVYVVSEILCTVTGYS